MQLAVHSKNREQVTADAVGSRFHHGQGDCGSYGGVHRVSAAQQRPQSGLGSERLGSGHHVVSQHRHPLRNVGQVGIEWFHARNCTGLPQPFTAPAVSPSTIRFWKISTSAMSGILTTIAASMISPNGSCLCNCPVKSAIATGTVLAVGSML